MPGPLEGLLAVTVEQAVAAPYCSSRLADAGARVIKVERPGGDFAREYDHVVHGESAYFVWLNRGKESVVLDFKQDADAALLQRLVAAADIFVANLAPGAAERAGFGVETLRRRNPQLIICSIMGYAEDGPARHMKAYDLLVQAETGLCSITGTAEEAGRVGVSVCDIAAGMYAYSAILEAVIERGRTGEGKAVSVSLFDGMADWMTVPLLYHDYGGRAPSRVGVRHPSIAPYAAFDTLDGKQIVISIQNEREWARFAEEIMGRPEWVTDGPYKDAASRVINRVALETEITKEFLRLDRATLVDRLSAVGIAFGRLNSVAEFAEHPDLRRVTVETATGPVDMPAPPARVAGVVKQLGAVPEVGQHTKAIQAEFS